MTWLAQTQDVGFFELLTGLISQPGDVVQLSGKPDEVLRFAVYTERMVPEV